MGQLDLFTLAALGDAAVRAINWISGMTEAEADELECFLTDLRASGTRGWIADWDSTDGTFACTSVHVGGATVVLRTEAEQTGAAARAFWSFNLAWDADAVQRPLRLWHVGCRVKAAVRIPDERYRDGVGRLEVWLEAGDSGLNAPVWLKEAKRHADLWAGPWAGVDESPPDSPFGDARAMMQGIDTLTRGVVVTIDPNWRDEGLRATVMAQIVEWCFRVSKHSEAFGLPLPAQDAIDWWQDWAVRVVRRGRDADHPDVGDLYQIAARSVRPARAAGHRLFWKKSLAALHSESLLRQAAGAADISLRTAYNRLRQGGRQTSDFLGAVDPLGELTDFLRRQAPARCLAVERHTLLEVLESAGWNKEAARKLERRLRTLPPDEQERRIRANLARRSRQDQ
jgi:hypothetical protein